MNKMTTFLLSVFAIAVVANLVLLNYTIFRLVPTKLEALSIPKNEPTPSLKPEDSCGIACQQALQFALKQVDQKIATLGSKVSTPSVSIRPDKTPVVVATTKESFVPMGTGSTTKNDWEDVSGSDVFINTANFPNIKEAYFEVSMHIPTKNGIMTARLYNVTDKHPVWYSDVTTQQDVSTFVSSKITLDPGNKQYRIQLKTSLEYQSLLDSARIKILSN